MTPGRRDVLRWGTAAGAAAIAAPLIGQQDRHVYPMNPQPVADGIWMLAGADEEIAERNGGAIANITILDAPEGAILVDVGPSRRYAEALTATARQLTGKPVARIFITHLHPDHGLALGNLDPATAAALPATVADMARDNAGFSDALYRILGDWMRGTEPALPALRAQAGVERVAGRELELLALSGHSNGDLAVLDRATGTVIAGDLVFHDRAPTTPTADLARWRDSLDRLRAVPHQALIPGHGPLDPEGTVAIDQTRAWLDWLEDALEVAARAGLDPVAAGNIPIPERFAGMKVARYELQRSVVHLYPAIEARVFPRVDR